MGDRGASAACLLIEGLCECPTHLSEIVGLPRRVMLIVLYCITYYVTDMVWYYDNSLL
jgi:hypothetical protein